MPKAKQSERPQTSPTDPLKQIADLAESVRIHYPEVVNRGDGLEQELLNCRRALSEPDLPAEKRASWQRRLDEHLEYQRTCNADCDAWWGKVQELARLVQQHLPKLRCWYVITDATPWHIEDRSNASSDANWQFNRVFLNVPTMMDRGVAELVEIEQAARLAKSDGANVAGKPSITQRAFASIAGVHPSTIARGP